MINVSEDRKKVLSLLQYALTKKGISNAAYFIGNEGDEKSQDDKLCLLQAVRGGWIILYIERGNTSREAWYSTLDDAATGFFWRLTRQDTPWDYRVEWETETSQHF